MTVRTLAAGVLVAAAVACATNPATGRRELSLMSEAQEIQIGRENDVQIRREMGTYEDPALQQYVSDIGRRLAQVSERPALPWQFAVVDAPAINAFAVPGGFIYMTRGILPFLDDESQLAGVLGHEIGHVTARHSAQQYSRATGAGLGLLLGSIFVPQVAPIAELAQSGLGLLFLKYGRDDELEADQLGVRYAARGGWDPAGVAGMLRTLDRIDEGAETKGVPNWLSTHPAPADRVVRVQKAIESAAAGTTARGGRDRADYMRRIDGLVYGDNPDQGVVRGSRFLHRKLRFEMTFPAGWDVNNMPTQVAARKPDADVFVLLQIVDNPQGRSIEDAALAAMGSAGFRALEGARTQINGLDAFVATYDGTLEGLGRARVRAAHLLHDRTVFMIAGLASAQLYDSAERDFSASIRSFRPLTAAEAEQIRPNRIDLYTAREGDTWQSIAERQGKGVVKATTLAIMNGREPSEQPRAGERLKIVVGG
jgi:predicted Zn-dependent protease